MSNQTPAEALRQQILETLQVGSSLKNLYSDQADAIMERVTAYAATVEREAATKARVEEVTKALEAYNSFEEYRQDPSQDLKPGNVYLLARLAALQGPPEEQNGKR